ncbi:MAG: head GIN domain-containing protein [Bacteroidota bacterium]
MKNHSKSLLLCMTIALSGFAQAQELQKKLDVFDKIIVSPKINLVLQKGDQESIRIKYSNVSSDKINIEVSNNRLRIYLDDARIVDKHKRMHDENYSSNVSIYHDAVVTAYVTYRELKVLDVRGEEEVTCDGAINSEKFKLKAYGEAEINLVSLHTKKFKAVLYGENKLTIKEGQTGHQRYRLYGENKIDTRALTSETISSTIYGEGRLSVNASDEVRINAFGEPKVNVSGTSHISRGIIIGKADIRMK